MTCSLRGPTNLHITAADHLSAALAMNKPSGTVAKRRLSISQGRGITTRNSTMDDSISSGRESLRLTIET